MCKSSHVSQCYIPLGAKKWAASQESQRGILTPHKSYPFSHLPYQRQIPRRAELYNNSLEIKIELELKTGYFSIFKKWQVVGSMQLISKISQGT